MMVRMSKKKENSRLCFARAFPRTRAEYDEAHESLQHIEETLLRYPFSFEVARWLARTSPGAVSIDWSEVDDTEPLDDLLRQVLQPCEDEYFDSGYATTREWVELASRSFRGTDFDWLMAQLGQRQFQGIWRQLYDAADVPLVWGPQRQQVLEVPERIPQSDDRDPRGWNAASSKKRQARNSASGEIDIEAVKTTRGTHDRCRDGISCCPTSRNLPLQFR